MNRKRVTVKSKWLRLGLGAACVTGLWLVVLPHAATMPAVHAHLRHLEAYDVNAGAMYYTELNAMPRILEKLERRGIASVDFDRPRDRTGEHR